MDAALSDRIDYRAATAEDPGRQLAALLRLQAEVERREADVQRVDGALIGTGQADFTVETHPYLLARQDRIFELVDVPGIEGNEAQFDEAISAAVARAHFVFFVNGTNKKPEAKTLEKIARYLRRDSVVHPICNLRGLADAYEFHDDRIDLEHTHSDAAATRAQTAAELGKHLPAELLAECLVVQGLLGFCALARDRHGGSTIVVDRADLQAQQHAYLAAFGDAAQMRRFSRIDRVADVIERKLSTFDADIVEANKRKALRMLQDRSGKISSRVQAHAALRAKVAAEVESCRKSVKEALQGFEQRLSTAADGVVNACFETLREEARGHVRDLSGRDAIERAIGNSATQCQAKLQVDLDKAQNEALAQLEKRVEKALKRLHEDMEQLRIPGRLGPSEVTSLATEALLDGLEFGLSDARDLFLRVGTYASSGAMLGNSFPVIGNLIGAAIGAAVALLVSVFEYVFVGREKRVREAQATISADVEAARTTVLRQVGEQRGQTCAGMRAQVEQSVLQRLDSMLATLDAVGLLLQRQAAAIEDIAKDLKGRPHGHI